MMNRQMAALGAGVMALAFAGSALRSSEPAIQVPHLDGEYVAVYRPAGDAFAGPDSAELKAGQRYETWVPNDHTIIKGPDGRWHAFGITHPLTSTQRVHDGEYQSFHAVAPEGVLSDVLREGAWKDARKVLTPAERPEERLEFYAPHIVGWKGAFYMFYGPDPIRLATSTDLWKWTPGGTLFGEGSDARDPSVMAWEGKFYLVYCVGSNVALRTSTDLRRWSAPRTILQMQNRVAPESPTLVRLNGTFYLFVCGFDGMWDGKTVQGAYQHVTRVYQSDDVLQFGREVAVLQAHAPEVFQDEKGQWYISSAEWPERGVSVAKLKWR